VSENPPLVSISFIGLLRNKQKDTRKNILMTKDFTVNIISERLIEAASATAIEAPPDVDEWTVSGLTMTPSVRLSPCLVFGLPDISINLTDDCEAPVRERERNQHGVRGNAHVHTYRRTCY